MTELQPGTIVYHKISGEKWMVITLFDWRETPVANPIELAKCSNGREVLNFYPLELSTEKPNTTA